MNRPVTVVQFIKMYRAGNRKQFPRIREIEYSFPTDYRKAGINLREEMSTLIEEIKPYPNIVSLKLQYSPVVKLPDSIGDLRSLQHLMLGDSQISKIPSTIGNLTNLRTLQLGNNQISVIPDTIGNLTALEELEFDGNRRIKSLPDSIRNCTALRILNLNANSFTSVPQSILNLRALQKLDLSHNQLQTIPDNIGNLRALQTLNLNFNQLQTLPDSIGNLTRLRELWLNFNQLQTLPESITNLRFVRIDIDRNPLQNIPPNIAQWVRQQNRRYDENNDNNGPVFPENPVEVHQAAFMVNRQLLQDTLRSIVSNPPSYSPSQFRNYLTTTLQSFLNVLEPAEKAQLQPDYNRVVQYLSGLGFPAEHIPFFTLIFEYVKRQTPVFKENYIKGFVVDCAHAYTGGGMSCGAGMMERLYLTLLPACMSYGPDSQKFKEQKCGTIINAIQNKEIYKNTNTTAGSPNVGMIINTLKYMLLKEVKEEVCTESTTTSTAGPLQTTKSVKEIEDLYRRKMIDGVKNRAGQVSNMDILPKIDELMKSLGAGTEYSVFNPDQICEFTIPQEGGKKYRKKSRSTRRHKKANRKTKKSLSRK